MSIPLNQRLNGLTIARRHPHWLRHYRQGDWLPWHMSLIGHGALPRQESTSLMDGLYRTDTQKTPAASALLSFEGRTVLGHLPPTTGVKPALLQDFAEDLGAAADLRPFWTTLDAHFRKHVTHGDSGPFLAAAATACMRHFEGLMVLTPQEVADMHPGEVDTPEGYARLARLMILLALMPERPFSFSLYCASSDYEPLHALALNLRIDQTFLQGYGVLDAREILLGLTLAGRDQVAGPGGGVTVPVFTPALYFSTLFAPTPVVGQRMYQGGRSCHLIL